MEGGAHAFALGEAPRIVEVSPNQIPPQCTAITPANGTTTPRIPVASYVAWDLRTAYNWHMSPKRESTVMTVALGVNNLTNRMPPLAPRAFLDNNADVATFSPIGRLIYGSVSVSF